MGVARATVYDGADVQATVTDGASITSSTFVNVTAELQGSNTRNEAIATGKNLNLGVFAAASIFAAQSYIGGAVRAELDGSVTGSTGVSVMATGANFSQAQLLVVAVSGLAGIAVSLSDAEIGTAAKSRGAVERLIQR